MYKITPLNARPTLKLGAKKEANVNATRERLARSIDFSAYNLRWNSFISIPVNSIAVFSLLSRILEKIGTATVL